MVQQNNQNRLQSAWRALAGDGIGDGWRTIPIEIGGTCRLLAGRHFPDDKEAILVGFNSITVPSDDHLPRGRGFQVEKVTYKVPGITDTWISLSRQAAGSIEMFARMAEDIMNMLCAYDHANDEELFKLFLYRIKAWQEFMERGRSEILGHEEEIGLFGELSFLKKLLEAKVPAIIALEGWHGPLDGLQDFSFGTGAIEVKSTLATNGFYATISSLEQLDESLIQPLFIAGIKLSLDRCGITLPEVIAGLRHVFSDNYIALGLFDSLVLHAGFLECCSGSYERRFLYKGMMVLPVDADFPSLTRADVNIAIMRARYELDLGLVSSDEIELNQALKELGVF